MQLGHMSVSQHSLKLRTSFLQLQQTRVCMMCGAPGRGTSAGASDQALRDGVAFRPRKVDGGCSWRLAAYSASNLMHNAACSHRSMLQGTIQSHFVSGS